MAESSTGLATPGLHNATVGALDSTPLRKDAVKNGKIKNKRTNRSFDKTSHHQRQVVGLSSMCCISICFVPESESCIATWIGTRTYTRTHTHIERECGGGERERQKIAARQQQPKSAGKQASNVQSNMVSMTTGVTLQVRVLVCHYNDRHEQIFFSSACCSLPDRSGIYSRRALFFSCTPYAHTERGPGVCTCSCCVYVCEYVRIMCVYACVRVCMCCMCVCACAPLRAQENQTELKFSTIRAKGASRG